MFKPVDDFDKDRNDVILLIWENAGVEHCALIKNKETLLGRLIKVNQKFFYCDTCRYWFNSQIQCDKHKCSHSFKPEIVCPKKKKITFINEHKRQNIKKHYNR